MDQSFSIKGLLSNNFYFHSNFSPMTSVPVHSKALVLLLIIQYLLLHPLFMGVLCLVDSVPLWKMGLVPCLELASGCHVAVIVFCLFFMVPWVCLWRFIA